jgi:hypothetical protein
MVVGSLIWIKAFGQVEEKQDAVRQGTGKFESKVKSARCEPASCMLHLSNDLLIFIKRMESNAPFRSAAGSKRPTF